MNNHLMPKYVIQYEVQNIDNFQTAAIFHFWDIALHIPKKGLKMHVMRGNPLFPSFFNIKQFSSVKCIRMQLFVTDRGTSVVLFGT